MAQVKCSSLGLWNDYTRWPLRSKVKWVLVLIITVIPEDAGGGVNGENGDNSVPSLSIQYLNKSFIMNF
jgi:hypothetical protein